MRRRFWFAFAFLAAAIAAWMCYSASQPPVKFVPFASITVGQPITSCWLNRHPDRHVLVAVTKDAKIGRIRVKAQTLVCEPVRVLLRQDDEGFFDFDRDGYEEFFTAEHANSGGFYLWVFKRKESVRGRRLPPQTYPSWFSLPKSQWVLWSKILLEGGHCAQVTFVTEPKPHQPRKVVVVLNIYGSSGGPCLVLSKDGKQLHPFTKGNWQGVKGIEDLDHDGICELVLIGHIRLSPAAVGIYKWDGSTYRLWWPTEKRDGYVLYAQIQDLDANGTKDIVAVLDTKGRQGKESPFRALAIYWLEQGCYRKVVWCSLPRMTSNDECWWAPALVGVLRLRDGCLIMLERRNELIGYFCCPSSPQLRQVWQIKGLSWSSPWHSGCSHANGSDVFISVKFWPRLPEFLSKLLPPFVRDWLEQRFEREQVATLWLIWDGKTLEQKGRWVGWELSKANGTCGGKFWVVLAKKGKKVWRYTVLMADGQRLRKLWQGDFHASPDNVFAGDLDGDGNDELIVVEASKGKISVLKAK